MKHFSTKRSTSFLLLLFFVTTVSFAANPQGADRLLTATDFYRHKNSGKHFNEAWRYTIVLDNGGKIFLNYTYMDLPMKGTRSGTNISIYNFRGGNFSVGRDYPKERMVVDRVAKKISMTSGKSLFYMKGLPGDGHQVHFTTDKDEGFYLHLNFSQSTLGKVRGDGTFHLGKQSITQFIHLPYAKVRGRLGVGKDTIQVQGSVYMDHVWQTEMVSDLGKHEIQFTRKEKNELAGTISVGTCDYSSTLFGYALDLSGDEPKVVFPKKVTSGSGTLTCKQKVKKNLNVVWSDPTTQPLEFSRVDQQQFSPLEKIDGWFKKKALKALMGGELFFLRGRSNNSHGIIDYNISGMK